MRCRNHLYDVSSYTGVCASCLRERLSALIDAEAHVFSATFADYSRQSSYPPSPLLIPRSVSPYTFRRDLDDASAKHPWILPDRRFFSSPQSEISTASKTRKEHNNNTNSSSTGKFSLITKLFKSKSQKSNSDEIYKEDPNTAPISISTPRWFPSLRRNSKINLSTPNQTPIPARCTVTSPKMTSRDSQTGHQWKKTPINSASIRRSKSSTNFARIIFGLSPLLRPSPIPLSSRKSCESETAFCSFSGKFRVPGKSTMSTSSSLRGSRSTKLADFGRANLNR